VFYYRCSVVSNRKAGERTVSNGEPGQDLDEWEIRWEELQELAEDSPGEALPEIVRQVEPMIVDAGFDLQNEVVVEGEEDVVRDFLAARDIARAAERGAVDPEDVQTALEDLREIHDFLVEQRAR
jgi:hypothetical protein